MPARQPFTTLCQTLARKPAAGRADLHVHTTHSDGSYTPAEVVDLARRSGLAALAITDHDTTAAVAEARLLAGDALEIVSGVEISAEFHAREFHLLAYFIRLDDGPLSLALESLRQHRTTRFWEMVKSLQRRDVALDEAKVRQLVGEASLGRRNLAELLVRNGQASSVREAFQRYLGDDGPIALPKVRLPVAHAIALVRGAGGVTSWAHPAQDATPESLAELRAFGLQAVEVGYPGVTRGRSRELRALSAALGLAITAGSDCHGPGNHKRDVGACSVSGAELEALRARSHCAL